MKIVLKVVGVLLLLVVVVAIGGLIYLQSAFPKVSSARNIKVETTPERVARGKYLANHVSICIDCHSTRDFEHYAGPVIPGTEGKGGECFNENFGLPGSIYAKNITPAGIGDWTDGELIRAMTAGVNKKGEALFPIMPYMHFNNLCEEDLYSLVAYIRSLSPIPNSVPERSLNFPMNLIVRTIPKDASLPAKPDTNDLVAYGKYLVTISSCSECHTPMEKGKPIPGMDFAGGHEFQFPDGSIVRAANITPDNETGIGGWSKEFFLKHFKMYDAPGSDKLPVEKGKNTVMPILKYAGMTEKDLGSIYAYLRTVSPVHNLIKRYGSVSEAFR